MRKEGDKTAIKFDALPNELKTRNQWVLWKTIIKAGKASKVPFDTKGNEGDSSDPSRWESYDAVVAAYQKGGYDGVGFTFDVLDPYAGVDLDNCILPDGSIKPRAKAILDGLNSYSEISPSGKGIKVILKAKNPVKIRRDGGKFQQGFSIKSPELEFEVYYGYRFFTLTGNRLAQYSPNIEDRNDELTEIFKELFKDRNYFDGGSEPIHRESEPPSEHLSADAVERLQDLFEADPTFKDDFYSPAPIGHRSDAEFHICARLWEAGFDENEIYQIMDSSPQTKWLERGDDYRLSTISNSVANAEANHKKRVEEKAEDEAEKRAESITLKDVANIEYDENGKITDVRFSPTFAARVVLERMPLAMAEDSEDIYYFNGQIYKSDGARIIDLKLCDAAGDHVTGNALREILRRIRNELLEEPVVFDPDPYLLAVQNGVVSLLTGDFRDYTPEDLIIDQISVVFNPEARCPWFIAFLESITPNVSDRITLIDWFVATAIKEPLAFVLFLLGLGRNGKGIYERLLKKFFGQAAFRDMPLAEVSKNNFAASGFYRKRGWIASETGKKKTTIGTDFMKLVSGNGVIDGDRKNKDRIQFEPYFQTIVDTNTMPKIEDNSIGWIERFCKANLPYIFIENPDPNNPLEKKKDPALFEKLTTANELSGILNLLLFRSKVIGKSGQIHKRSGKEMFAEYAEQSSSVATFLELFCEFDGALSGLWTPSKPIYEAYSEWCRYKVGEVVDKAYFGRQLKKFCDGVTPKQGKGKDRKTQTEYKGLKFDQNKYQAAIEALRKSMSEECPKMSEVVSEEQSSQKISMSEVSEVNLWNDIKKRFGELPKEDKSLYGGESAKIPQTSQTPQTSIASEPVEDLPTPDKPKTIPQTKTIEAKLQQVEEARKQREEHFKTPVYCAVCGKDITNKTQLTKNGDTYCRDCGDISEPKKDCGSCPVAVSGDKSAIQCNPCVFLERAAT